MCEHALATVAPTVGTPSKSVKGFVSVLVSPTIEKNLRLASRLWFIAVFDRNEHQVRSSAEPDAAKTDFKTADEIEPFHEHGSAIEFAVAVCVFENEDAVLALAV